MGLVNKNSTSGELNKVEQETTILPTLTAKKKIKNIIDMNSCNRNCPIFILTRTYSIEFKVNKKLPDITTREFRLNQKDSN